jgi:hypothetical protein
MRLEKIIKSGMGVFQNSGLERDESKSSFSPEFDQFCNLFIILSGTILLVVIAAAIVLEWLY